MNQRNVLRVLGQQYRSPVQRIHELLLLHYDLRRHLRVNRAEVRVSLGLRKRVGKRVIRIECLRLERRLVLTDNRMRYIVTVRPLDRCTRGDRHCRRRIGKIVDLDFHRAADACCGSGCAFLPAVTNSATPIPRGNANRRQSIFKRIASPPFRTVLRFFFFARTAAPASA